MESAARRVRVLVLDDDTGTVGAALAGGEVDGLSVEVVAQTADPAEAAERAAARELQVLLVGLDLPRMRAGRALERLRARAPSAVMVPAGWAPAGPADGPIAMLRSWRPSSPVRPRPRRPPPGATLAPPMRVPARRSLRVAVSDEGGGSPAPGSPNDGSGRGLLLEE